MSCELSDLTARDRNTAEGLKMIRVKGEGKVFFFVHAGLLLLLIDMKSAQFTPGFIPFLQHSSNHAFVFAVSKKGAFCHMQRITFMFL